MTEIIPAVMPDNYRDLVNKVSRVADHADWVQIDIMDGHFVPSKSWPYVGDRDGHFEEMKNQDEGLPSWEKVNFSVDMMIGNAETAYKDWVNVGVARLIFHYKALKDTSPEFFKKVKEETGIEVNLAITPDVPNDVLDPLLETLDGVQFMGINNIGYQGEPFVEETYEKVGALRQKSDIPIGIDGGVNFDTAQKLVEAGANRLVSGSVIFNSVDAGEKIEEFNELVN